MIMEEKQITERESLLLIQQMINTAKDEQKDNGKGWIIWGWFLFTASVCTLLNLHFKWFSNNFFWNAFGVITILFGLYEIINYLLGNRKMKVKTYTIDLFQKLNIGFFISLTLIIFSMNIGAPTLNIPPQKGFALLLGLYGFWILIYGAVLNFNPSIIGAYITWGFAFASLFVNSFAYTMLFHALAVLAGYIIPGHIANKQFNAVNKKVNLTGV